MRAAKASGGGLVAVGDGGTQWRAVYSYGAAGLFWRRGILDGTSTRWSHADWLGSVRMLSDASKSVTDTHNYDAFGNIIEQSGQTPNPFRYVGQLGYLRQGGPATPVPPEYSSRTAYGNCYGGRDCLMLLGARWYDPVIGRFLTQDPIGYFGGMNVYAYVGNNPVNLADPSGLYEKISGDEARWLDEAVADIALVDPRAASELRKMKRRGKVGVEPGFEDYAYYQYPWIWGRMAIDPTKCFAMRENEKRTGKPWTQGPQGRQRVLWDQFWTEATLIHELRHSHQFFMWRHREPCENAAYGAALDFLKRRLKAEKSSSKRQAIKTVLDDYPKSLKEALEQR